MTAQLKRGFTLIELLIVMAILGVLAVVVLVAINPVQQLARTRDSGRKSGVTQIGHAVEAYYTSHGGVYPDATTCGANWPTWIDCIVTAGELASVPQAITNSLGADCSANNPQAGFCYSTSGTDAVIYATLESASENDKCTASGAGGNGYFVWSTADGRGGLVCAAAEPSAGTQTFNSIQ